MEVLQKHGFGQLQLICPPPVEIPAPKERRALTCLEQFSTRSLAKTLAPPMSQCPPSSRPMASQPAQPRHHKSPSMAREKRHLEQTGGGIQRFEH